jgi:hypothetical protein
MEFKGLICRLLSYVGGLGSGWDMVGMWLGYGWDIVGMRLGYGWGMVGMRLG